jgi:8-oxo-dGTP diphosphatase
VSEEIGIEVEPDDLTFVGFTRYGSPPGEGIDLFFTAARWVGEPNPLAGCDELRWCRPDDLPTPTPRFVRRAVMHHLVAGQPFDEFGWETAWTRYCARRISSFSNVSA